MLCNECNDENAKYRYKCCLLHFCSLSCYKSHKCNRIESEDKNLDDDKINGLVTENSNLVFDTSAQLNTQLVDDIDPEIKRRLNSDEDLKSYIKDIKELLINVTNSDDPVDVIHKNMSNQQFKHFINHIILNYI
ncbi:uncharacterized protein TA05260 [Theileria annulata]|uniref:HIT-type domain-containing protein n=1 Tax=Theileria annulata TaxID=5874 RepID=Q4UCV2_THEAN|nr:uncharacterized protein TA05260 [Theileria annulata]CAI75349.1 hypothetical protein TA05260 [Theileria annulata]|eukprot:XP_954825.1 hypothetical protein TA05260 [Theileria annulata]